MNRTRLIKVGSFIDGSGTPVRRNVFLAVKDGLIDAIGPAADLSEHQGTAVADFSRCTIVPALVDCSVSLSRSPSVNPKVRLAVDEAGLTEKVALMVQHIRYCFSHGVLGVADNDNTIGLREHLHEVTGGGSIDIRTAGSDFLRISYAGILDEAEASDSGLALKNLQDILQQKTVEKTVVVANGEQRVKEALAAGCDAIEQGYNMGEDNLRKMVETDVLWIPSVLLAKNGLDGAASGGEVACRFSMRYAAPGKPDPGAEVFWKKMLVDQLNQLRLAKRLGVKTAIGTGAGNVGILHGESMVDEMKLFIKAGWSPEETIRCGSVNGAGFFGMENFGELSVGRRATFLVARGTVQQLPRKLGFLENIYVDGESAF